MSASRLLQSGHASLVARAILGAVFVYLGVTKALDPVGFLKLVRQFDLLTAPLALNLVATLVPWCEIVFGVFLLVGKCSRGAALVSLLMLLGFTTAITLRAVALHRAGTAAFCSLRFDCGCGTGEVLICLKLLENVALCGLAALIVLAPEHPFPFRRRPVAA